jgi:hypothetical protein
MVTIKKTNVNVGEFRERGPILLFPQVGIQIISTITEVSLEIPQKLRIELPYDSTILHLKNYKKYQYQFTIQNN